MQKFTTRNLKKPTQELKVKMGDYMEKKVLLRQKRHSRHAK